MAEPAGMDVEPEITESKRTHPSATANADEVMVDADEQTIRNTRRLYLRNLPYSATEDDVTEHFAAFDGLEEVSACAPFHNPL